MDLTVKNINDLQSEIIRVEKLKQQQEIDLKQRLRSPSSVFSAVMSLFPKSGDKPNSTNIFNQDILGLLSRVVLPFTLNKTLFKSSGFLVKTLVGLLSQKASGYVSQDNVVGIWDKAKELFGKVLSGIGKKDKETTALHHQSAVL